MGSGTPGPAPFSVSPSPLPGMATAYGGCNPVGAVFQDLNTLWITDASSTYGTGQ